MLRSPSELAPSLKYQPPPTTTVHRAAEPRAINILTNPAGARIRQHHRPAHSKHRLAGGKKIGRALTVERSLPACEGGDTKTDRLFCRPAQTFASLVWSKLPNKQRLATIAATPRAAALATIGPLSVKPPCLRCLVSLLRHADLVEQVDRRSTRKQLPQAEFFLV